MWDLDHKEGWEPKNWCLQTRVLEKTIQIPLDSKEIKPVNPKGNQPWIFIGRTDAEVEASIIWPPDVRRQLIGKDCDARKAWRQKEKEVTEVGWHHQFSGHEFEQAPGEVKDREAWRAAGLPWWLSWQRFHLQCGRPRFNPWVGKISWRREWLPTPVFWLGEFHGQYSPMRLQRVGHDWTSLISFSSPRRDLCYTCGLEDQGKFRRTFSAWQASSLVPLTNTYLTWLANMIFQKNTTGTLLLTMRILCDSWVGKKVLSRRQIQGVCGENTGPST